MKGHSNQEEQRFHSDLVPVVLPDLNAGIIDDWETEEFHSAVLNFANCELPKITDQTTEDLRKRLSGWEFTLDPFS